MPVSGQSGEGATLRYSSTITIEELTGTAQGGPRRVILRGPSMPFMGAEWSAGNNVVTTFYPGNPVGSQQMLGPREMPSAWQGEWNRTLLGKSPVIYRDETESDFLITRPDLVWDVLEDIFRKGALLRVTWSTHGAEMVGDFDKTLRVINSDRVRDGRAKEWKFQPDRHTDIKWSITFDWLGRGGEQLRAADVREDSDLAADANGLENSIALTRFLSEMRAKSLVPDVRLSASHITLGQLEALADAPNQLVLGVTRDLTAAVNQVKRVVDLGKKIGNIPDQIRNTITDFSRNTEAIAKKFDDSATRFPCELASKDKRVGPVMRGHVYMQRMSEQTRVNARLARNIIDKNKRFVADVAGQGKLVAKDTSASRAGEVVATYVSKEGDTPQLVSMRFYGTPDRAIDILQMNRLPWHTPTFRRGTVLIIPQLSTTRRT